MSKGVKKAWPYIVILVVLAAIAILSEDYLPFDLFGNNKVVEDTTTVEVDSLEIEEDIAPLDTAVIADTLYGEYVPEVVDEPVAKEWCLVVASTPSKDLADKIAAKTGIRASVKYVEYLDTYRVVYNSYANLREAQVAFDEISIQYPKAWLVYF